MRALAPLVACVLQAGVVHAEDTRDACIAVHEEAQLLRADHALRAARARLLECAAICPSQVARECGAWLEQVEASQPQVVIEVHDASGAETSVVRVSIDGELYAERISGAAIAVDPGEHRFRFEVAGEPPLERDVIVREGEKNRRLVIRSGSAVTREAEPASTGTALTTASLVIGGIGVVAMACFTGFAVSGKAKQDELESTCAGHCPNDEVDTMYERYLAADVSLGIGVTTLVTAGVLGLIELLRPGEPPPPPGVATLRF